MWKKWCIALSCFSSLQAQILMFSGSTRKDSANQKLILQAARLAEGMKKNVCVISLKDYPLPIYNGDLESAEGVPQNAKLLRSLFANSQIVVISSPEYNHSISPLVKNTIDWISRIVDHDPNPFRGKTFVLLSASPGGMGGKRGLDHLKTTLTALGGNVWPTQLSVSNAYNAFDQQGKLKDPQLEKDLQNLLQQAIESQQTKK